LFLHSTATGVKAALNEIRRALLLLTITIWAASQEAFKYDKPLPLDVHQHEVALRDGVRIVLLNIAVASNVRADCLLVAPERVKAKTGAIVWMHSGGFFEQIPDAILLAQAGAISLLIDPIVPDWRAAPETWHSSMVQAVISVRRGVDLLLERSDVDPQRLAYVGHSYGALMGVDAAATDRRFRAAVFEVGLPGMSVHIRTAQIPFATEIRKRLGSQLDSALSRIEPLDAIHYVNGLAPTALLFQSAHLDL
jgi:acetyl esterase/lipase